MNRTLNHPWNELNRVWNMVDQLFCNPVGTGSSSRGKFPKVQAWSRDGHYVVTAELPGLELDAVNVSAQGNTLTISGELTQPPATDGVYHRNERAYDKFHRELRLPISCRWQRKAQSPGDYAASNVNSPSAYPAFKLVFSSNSPATIIRETAFSSRLVITRRKGRAP
jgi:HSP20 family molecular chaperone IbpA